MKSIIEPAHDVIERHPEVKSVIMRWMWPFYAILEHEFGFVLEAEGSEVDWEYCVIGSREFALEKLSRYDCWDGMLTDESVDLGTHDGVFILNYYEDTYSSYYRDELPAPDDICTLAVKVLRSDDMP